MIALDTNVLVRLATQDEKNQLNRVKRLLSKPGPFFISNLVFIESVWVLESVYEWSPKDIVAFLLKTLSKTDLVVDDEELLREAILAYEKNGDFSDQLICLEAKKKQCVSLASFDDTLKKLYKDFVIEP